MNDTAYLYTVLIPIKDEAENLKPLIEELEGVMKEIGDHWELICIDDGSTDDSAKVLETLRRSRPFLKIISMKQNYGQSTAFAAGFERAKGEYVITLDGDRQNDPEDIPRLLTMMSDYDMVCGIRKKRQDSLMKKWISKGANAIRSRVCKDGMRDTGCSLKVYRAACLRRIKMFEGMHRFLPALFVIEGFKVGQTEVNHRERPAGKSKYSLANRSLNTIFDMFAVVWMRKRHLAYEVEGE